MKSYIQFITTPTVDTARTSILLQSDNKRYLVGGLAEGLQRACVETGTRLLKLGECFLTGRSQWQNTGGLIGMLLTVADSANSSRASFAEEARRSALAKARKLGMLEDEAKVQALIDEGLKNSPPPPRVTFFAPPNLNYQLATARRFVFRTGMPVTIHEIADNASESAKSDTAKPYWSDQNMEVWPMSIQPFTSSKPINPRKRSFEMLDNDQEDDRDVLMTTLEVLEQEQQKLVVKSVVDDMFNSTWKLDTLYETRLADVSMPASIFVRNQNSKKIEKYKGPMPGGATNLPDPDLMVLVRKPWPSASVNSLPPATPGKEAISYIFRNRTQRGRFHPEKAKALKVLPGNKFAQLAAGESVENADGQIIHPEQVLGPSRLGCCFAVLDLPDVTYIDALISRPEWANGVAAGIALVIWNCGKGVAKDRRLQDFISGLPDTKHIISSPEHCGNYLAFSSAAAATIRLQQVDQSRYNPLIHEAESEQIDLSDYPSNVTFAKPGLRVDLEPSVRIVEDMVIKPLQVQDVIEEMPTEILEEVQKATAAITASKDDLERWSKDLPGKDVEVSTLGTGSAQPSKYRNVSATLLRVPGWGSMLFDCGENTLGQLRRAFPPDEFKQILRGLKAIVISHMHADHHLGLVSVIKAWYEEVHALQPLDATSAADSGMDASPDGRQMLSVMSEPAMQAWLLEYAAMEDYGYSRIAPLVLTVQGQTGNGASSGSSLYWYTPASDYAHLDRDEKETQNKTRKVSPAFLGLSEIQAVGVHHCANARAVSLTWPDGFKASYSGDCRPSTAFSRIGYGSTVCIHEATFDDELAGDARAKSHSTTSEALRVAQNMNAKTCILTHFSQRYQKVPILERNSGGDAQAITEPVPLEEETDGAADDEAPPGETEVDGIESQQNGLESVSAVEPMKFKLETDMQVCMAFDFMRVKVGEIAQMQYFTPALLKLFAYDQKTGNDPPVPAANGDTKNGKSKRRN